MAQLNDLIVTGAARFVNKIQGTVDKATCDADGANIASTYMKKGVDYVTAGQRSGTSSASNATMEGSETWAAQYAHAEGYKTSANGHGSHAEGGYATGSYCGTLALGSNSHSEGILTTAGGDYSHAEGNYTYASNTGSHAEGNSTKAPGVYSHAEGYSTTSYGRYSHAEGNSTSAYENSAHAEGYLTKALGGDSHAEGCSTTAATEYSHAEGYGTSAYGNSTHAEGYNTRAIANYTHSEGYYTTAGHQHSHAEGNHTKTGRTVQHVMGIYNEGKSDTLFEIGYGSSSVRKNVFEVTDTGVRPVVISTETKNLTTNCDVTFKLWSNGMKSIQVQAPSVAASMFTSATNFTPAAYLPSSAVDPHSYLRFVGYNASPGDTAGKGTRCIALGGSSDNRLWLYASPYVGFFITAFYI